MKTLAIALAAFSAGILTAHFARADAAAPPLVAQAVDVGALTPADLPAPSSGSIRSKLFVDGDSMTLGVYVGASAKHFHAGSDEFQYVVKGTGTEWFGDKQIALKPGMLLIIPKGMIHGGLSDGVTILGMKTPPQGADDNHRVP